MKARSFYLTTLCALFLGAGFTACDDDEMENTEHPDDITETRLSYILNEGSWGGNNACLSLKIWDKAACTISQTTDNVYERVNGQKLGDLANAMVEEDNNLYIVMNGSKYVNRLNHSAKEQARYTFPETEGAPRCIEVEDGYAYVTQVGGQVSKLNAEDLTLVGTFKGGDNLEGIVEKDGKLYVSNAYKVDGSGNYIYNKEVLVLDAKTMTQVGSIEVVENPDKIYEIDDKIYLLSKGNYYDVDAALQVIDPTTLTAKPVAGAGKITEGNDGLIYCVRSGYDANWNLSNTFFTYNTKTGQVNESSFLVDAPTEFATAAIYLLEVDEETGNIFVGTSDYTTNGTIYQFDRSGKLVNFFDAGGINPSTMVFIE